MKIKVKPMYGNSNRSVPNQYQIITPKGIYFQSYNSIIAYKPYYGKTELDEYYWDYSRTTGKYRNMFLNEYIDETREKIKSGKYKLTNLN
jgi:hypothetical protein